MYIPCGMVYARHALQCRQLNALIPKSMDHRSLQKILFFVPLMFLHVWKIDFAHLHLDYFFLISQTFLSDFVGSYLLARSQETMPSFVSHTKFFFVLVGRLIKKLKQCQNTSFCCISLLSLSSSSSVYFRCIRLPPASRFEMETFGRNVMILHSFACKIRLVMFKQLRADQHYFMCVTILFIGQSNRWIFSSALWTLWTEKLQVVYIFLADLSEFAGEVHVCSGISYVLKLQD